MFENWQVKRSAHWADRFRKNSCKIFKTTRLFIPNLPAKFNFLSFKKFHSLIFNNFLAQCGKWMPLIFTYANMSEALARYDQYKVDFFSHFAFQKRFERPKNFFRISTKNSINFTVSWPFIWRKSFHCALKESAKSLLSAKSP